MSDERQSLTGYRVVLIVYGVLVLATAVAVRLTGRQLPRGMGLREVFTTALAAQKVSRLVTKAAVTAPLRAPVTRPRDDGGPGEVNEEPKSSSGAERSLGELLTCPFCFDVWAVTGLSIGHLFAPRSTRVLVDAMAALAGADFLHLAYAAAQRVAER
ncbi:DUF1360 domain-containing protein [Nocardia sp. CDC159]|uniref:DUF1360 domain-containing protein n=1 Tax=Nocardia pulmonis TaxID=2951408 RepID=A0A9X2IZX6_9NOCA|nr:MULTISPECIES: DUF1360 domain-containing protein [Nocardia]MCM6778582.1 DUF1360 domain-containing protein [Nocardia pulmonis]MCM6791471.1 DUF1360 domain-containing protein [Nocardia sp. CDC159]